MVQSQATDDEPTRIEVFLGSGREVAVERLPPATVLEPYPNEKKSDSPQEAFFSELASTVAETLGADLDALEIDTTLGELAVDGSSWDFKPMAATDGGQDVLFDADEIDPDRKDRDDPDSCKAIIGSSGRQCGNGLKSKAAGEDLCGTHVDSDRVKRVDEFVGEPVAKLRDELVEHCDLSGSRAYQLATVTHNVAFLWDHLTAVVDRQIGGKQVDARTQASLATSVANHPDLEVDDHLMADDQCVAITGSGNRCPNGRYGLKLLCGMHDPDGTQAKDYPETVVEPGEIIDKRPATDDVVRVSSDYRIERVSVDEIPERPREMIGIDEDDRVRVSLVGSDHDFVGSVIDAGSGGWDVPENEAECSFYIDDELEQVRDMLLVKASRDSRGDWSPPVAYDLCYQPEEGERERKIGPVLDVELVDQDDDVDGTHDENSQADTNSDTTMKDQRMDDLRNRANELTANPDLDDETKDEVREELERLERLVDEYGLDSPHFRVYGNALEEAVEDAETKLEEQDDDEGVEHDGDGRENVLDDQGSTDAPSQEEAAHDGTQAAARVEEPDEFIDSARRSLFDVLDELELADDVDDDPDAVQARREQWENAGLSGKQAHVYALKQVGLTHAEIADRMDSTKGTIDQHAARAKAKLDGARELVRVAYGGER